MRDPKRIKAFCDQLAEIWEQQCPDWRFNQLVENVYRANDIYAPFFMEDDAMMTCIKRTFGLDKVERKDVV